MSWCTINQWGLSIPKLKDKIEKNIKKKRKKSNYLSQLAKFRIYVMRSR
jgi:hypothetical protein